MEGASSFKENPPPQVVSSADEDQSATAASTAHFSELAPIGIPILTSPVADGEIEGPEQNHGMPVVPQYTTQLTILENYEPLENTLEAKPLQGELIETKIVARLSTEDDYIPPISSPQTSNGQLTAKTPTFSTVNAKSTEHPKRRSYSVDFSRGQIDTAAPFESVKAAVSKFGGIVDWKAHRVQTVERRKFIEQELEKAHEEIPSYKQQAEAAEDGKAQVLKELDSTKRLVEELKLNLERAQTEEQQAKQDSELAKLRVEEMEKGIANDSSFAAKAQLEVAKARHVAAILDLKSVKDELEQLRKDYALLASEKDAAVRKAEEAASTAKEVETSVDDFTIELITIKESLESAHAAHLEAEEQRIGMILAKEQDTLNWEKELKLAEEELEKLNRKILSTKDLKLNLNKATVLLQELKDELAAYMESNAENTLKEPEKKTRGDIEVAMFAAKRELDEVKLNIEKETDKAAILKVAATSLTSDLEKEQMELSAVQQREGIASIAVSSLEDELKRTKLELSLAQMKEKEEKEKMKDLHKKQHEAAQEADQAKALAGMACNKLRKAKEELEKAKAAQSTIVSRLHAAEKEIEASKASEKLALAAIHASEESESTRKEDDSHSPTGITLSLEEYYKLSKRSHKAEEQAIERVAAAISQIEVAKDSELRSLKKLEEVNLETAGKKDALEIALQKAEEAKEGKLGAEHELRKWRAETEQKRKPVESVPTAVNAKASLLNRKESGNFISMPDSYTLHQRMSPQSSSTSNTEAESNPEKMGTKKKKKFFPRVFMFLARRKAQSNKLS